MGKIDERRVRVVVEVRFHVDGYGTGRNVGFLRRKY